MVETLGFRHMGVGFRIQGLGFCFLSVSLLMKVVQVTTLGVYGNGRMIW